MGSSKPDMKDGVASRLGANLHYKGEITGSGDLVIEGSFEGLVQLDERKVTIEKTAKVTADIIAGEVLVYGIVKGAVRAKSLIEVKKDGSVDGNLKTAQIGIEDGAFFKGSIDAETTHTAEPSRPKIAEPVPQPKDAGVPGSCFADTPRPSAEKDDEKQLVETSRASSGTQALSPRPGESSALSHAKEAAPSIFKNRLFPKEKSPDFVSLHITSTLFPTPKPARTSVNKRATPPPSQSLPAKQKDGDVKSPLRQSSIKSVKAPRRLLRITIAAAVLAMLFAAGRIAVQQHSQKTLKDGKVRAALDSPATSEPKQRNETSAEITRRNPPAKRTQNIPGPSPTRNSSGQKANVRSTVPASEAVNNHPAVAPTPPAVTSTQIMNDAESSGRASDPPAKPTTQAGPTPGAPISALESKPAQTPESRPAQTGVQTGEGTTQSKDSNAASSSTNSSAVPAETSPTPTAADKKTDATPPKQPEASEAMPASPAPAAVNPSAPPASGAPSETNSKKPRGAERLQRGHLIKRVDPVYPEEAQRKGIEGAVKVHVVFSPEGAVTNVTVVSGPKELAKSAMDAVRQWRYSPTLFDGKPVETEDTVTLEFRLAKSKRQGSKKDKDEDDEDESM